MESPTEGISVSYKETQNSHSRDILEKVVAHALQHDGYVGGWLDSSTGLYYFDSSRVFPEDQLEEAIKFGIENEQKAIYVISTGTEIMLDDVKESVRSATIYDMQGHRLDGYYAPKRIYRNAANF